MQPMPPPVRPELTLGILAGGRATRLQGRDKAWLRRDGVPQVLRLVQVCTPAVSAILVSANGDPAAYRAHGLQVVADRRAGLGPIAGLEALAAACARPWLFTLPVDTLQADAALCGHLADAVSAGQGAYVEDDAGPQPLAALWPVAALRDAAQRAIAEGALAIHALHARMGSACVRIEGVRLGNLNTPHDLAAAGMDDA